uniref:Uncharacterized protein n=1 Tax=Panagrolaimus sp. ES5 TaxID=591445 RepID=A0AC34FLU4_9BILA
MLIFFVAYSTLAILETATVRKCNCDELSECRKEKVAKLDNCVNTCQTSNTSAILNGILQCIKPATLNGVDCIEQMNRQFCTNDLNVTIKTNDVLENPGTGLVRKLMHEKMLKAVDQPNFNALNILKSGLNSNETDVQKCLIECVQKASVISCLKEKEYEILGKLDWGFGFKKGFNFWLKYRNFLKI